MWLLKNPFQLSVLLVHISSMWQEHQKANLATMCLYDGFLEIKWSAGSSVCWEQLLWAAVVFKMKIAEGTTPHCNRRQELPLWAFIVLSVWGIRPIIFFSTGVNAKESASFIWLHLAQFHTEISFRPFLCKVWIENGWWGGRDVLGFGTWISK